MIHPATELYAAHVNPALVRLLGTFGYGRVFQRAQGSEVFDAEGRRYLDFLAGFGSANVGHNHPRLVARLQEALAQQLCHVIHTGPQPAAADLAHALSRLLPDVPMALFSLSGGEAVDAAMKLARAATGRSLIVSCNGAFHGSGLGNLSIMDLPRWRTPFEPLLPQCVRVPFGDDDSMERVLRAFDVAGVIMEVVQGEGGVNIAKPDYLQRVQQWCRNRGTLFIVDEVQTGLGRTGRMFAHQHVPLLDPDVVILGKALGAATLPVAATMTRRQVQERAYGSAKTFDLHGSTYAGYALGCVAALETLKILDEERCVEASAQQGTRWLAALKARLAGHPLVREVRGMGLMVAIELGDTGTGWFQKAAPGVHLAACKEALGQWLALRLLEAGHIVQPASQAWNVVKLTPPLNTSAEQLDQLTQDLGSILDGYKTLPPLLADVGARMGQQALSGWEFR